MGYHRAGFDVVGVDIVPQPDYPFEFHQADAMTFPLDGFDAIHASPPCPGESVLNAIHRREYERLLVPTLVRLADEPRPWVVENVENATAPAGLYKVRLCGSMFGLRVRRHRWFWSNTAMLVPSCDHRSQTDLIGVNGHADGSTFDRAGRGKGPRQAGTDEARDAMGMPWARSRRGVTNAIPPAYSEFIGAFLRPATGAEGSVGVERQSPRLGLDVIERVLP
jgi:DNA (cytosine-5)-methyltransferase 1